MLGVLSLFMLAFIVDAVTAQTVNPNPGVNAKSQTKSVPQTGNAKTVSKRSPGNEYVIIKQQTGHSKHQTFLRRLDGSHASTNNAKKGEIVKSKINGHRKRKTKKECWNQ